MDTVNLAARVRQRRLELGLTQRELAARAGISDTAIRKIENGSGTRYMLELAEGLHVPMQWLASGDPAHAPKPAACRNDRHLEIGRRIQQRRSELGLSQRELATRAGISSAAISKIERGSRSRYYEALAAALDVPLAWIETGEQTNNTSDYTRPQEPHPAGYWPFHAARLADFESLSPIKQRELDVRLSDFIAGALGDGHSTPP
ncbi:DNA-binding protein [Bordetella ansorpii]|uniref:DNA-binding protein n=1 Tax=Bordetella ansorpii TaxID=288768 RepID=A0A157SRB6_9BORD|nr:helix-turn-helix transcriptional regulator [Bordetella ansorpii]SAI72972.1 DNA-binding protein [Bordetella ansorpii]